MNRTQIKADCHRQEERTTPTGAKRFVIVNANRHENGEVKRSAYANADETDDHREETRTTDGRNSTDLVYDARRRRTNRMAHNHPDA